MDNGGQTNRLAMPYSALYGGKTSIERSCKAIQRVKSGASRPIKPKKAFEQFQDQQVHICGSLTSTASSSGCSSVESTSIELPSSNSTSSPSASCSSSSTSPSSQVQQGQQRERLQDFNELPDRQTTGANKKESNISKLDDEGLQVNEALYLRGPKRGTNAVDKSINSNSCCMINDYGVRGKKKSSRAQIGGQFAITPTNYVAEICEPVGMSEFSAFTLQKSFTIARHTTDRHNSRPSLSQQATTCDGSIKSKTVKRSSTVKIAPSSSPSGYCCCCSGDCGGKSKALGTNPSIKPRKVSSSSLTITTDDRRAGHRVGSKTGNSPVKPAGINIQFPVDISKRKPASISSALLRRATIIGRPLNNYRHDLPPPPESLSKSIGRAEGGKLALDRVHRPQTRRCPLPVPPPVVPLCKEIALFGNGEEPKRDKSSNHLNADSRDATHEIGPITHHLSSSQRNCDYNFKDNNCDTHGVNDNNIASTTENLSISSPDFAKTTENIYSATLARSLLNIDKLSEVPNKKEKFMDLFDDNHDDSKKHKYYLENWQNLDSLSYDYSHSPNSKRLRKGMANSCIYIAQQHGQNCQEDIKQVASRDSCDSKIVSGNNIGSTLGRKTGKFLEKLRQSFIINFNRSSSNTNTTTSTISTSENGDQSDIGGNNTNLSGSDISRKDSSGDVEKDVYREFFGKACADGEAIYDTPEYDGRQWSCRSVNISEKKMSRPAARPSIPPPPPPPPPLPATSLECAQPRSLHELDGACVEVEQEMRRADSNQLTQTKLKSIPIQSSNEHQVNSKFESANSYNYNNNDDHPHRDHIEQLNDEQKQLEREKEKGLFQTDNTNSNHKDSKKEHEVIRVQKCCQKATKSCQKKQEVSSLGIRQAIISSKVVTTTKTKRRKAVQFADDQNKTISSREGDIITQSQSRRNNLATFGQNLQAGKVYKEEYKEVAPIRGREGNFVNLKGDNINNKTSEDETGSTYKFNVSQKQTGNLAGGSLLSQTVKVNSNKREEGQLLTKRIFEEVNDKVETSDIKMGSSHSVANEAEDKSSCRSKLTAKTINFAPTTRRLDKKVSSSQNGTSIGNPMKKLSTLTDKLTVGEASKLKTTSHKETLQTKPQILQQQQGQTVCSKFKLEGRVLDTAVSTSLIPSTMSTTTNTVITPATTLISSKIEKYSASITANGSFAANQAQSMSTLAGTGTNMMSSQNLSLEDSLEKRRKSIQNGDVFIYPSLYKDLNECSKCARDNKICNCTVGDEGNDDENDKEKEKENENSKDNQKRGNANNNEPYSKPDQPTSLNSTSKTTLTATTASKQQTTTSATATTREASITKTADPIYTTTTATPSSESSQAESSTSTTLANSNNSKNDYNSLLSTEAAENFDKITICNAEHNKEQFCQDREQNQQQQHTSFSTRQTDSQLENEHQDYHWNKQLKTVYKISIATASIDQKSNQLRLSSPKVIVPNNNNSLRSSTPDTNSQHGSNLPSSSSSYSFSSSSSSSSSSSPPINICPPVLPRVMRNSNNNSSNETVNEYSQHTKKAYFDTSQSSLNIISDQQQQQPSFLNNNNTPSNSSSGGSCVLNICKNNSELTTRLSSPITAIAVNGATAYPALDRTLSGNSVKKLDQNVLNLGSTPLLNKSNYDTEFSGVTTKYNVENIYHKQNSSASSHQIAINDKSSSPKNLATIYCRKNHERSNLNNPLQPTTNTLEAKVTAISIGSPTRLPPPIDLEKILPPSLVTKCEKDSDKNGRLHNGKGTSDNINQNNSEQDPNINDEYSKESPISNEQQQPQLTCNLKIGDAIKITSTSICINSSKQSSPTSKVAGLSLASNNLNYTSIIPIEPLSSRRRNINNKLNRQAIHEDDDFDLTASTNSTQNTSSYSNPTTTIATTTSASPFSASQNILISELISMDKTPNTKILVSDETSMNINNDDVLEYSPILTGVRDYIKNVNTELQVKTSTASSINEELALVTSDSCDTSAALVMNPMTMSESISSKVANLNPANFGTVHKAIELESPKKSIFDGASKDEILEYLEDARERVPEILMAADDVMVISENELIVVNQLDPGSPATPISIVEETEVIESKSCNPNSAISTNSGAHPDKLRQHLQEMFQANFGSKSETTDDETQTTSDLKIGPTSSIDIPSITQNSESQFESSRRICNDLKAFSRVTGETLDSFEDQVSNNENLSDIQKLESDAQNNLKSDQKQVLADGRSSRQSVRTTTSSLSNTSNTSVGEAINASNLMNYTPSTMYTGRRNSTSETSPNARNRSCILQMMMLQQRYSNRDSLSSSSCSPPSSVSPSSTSSNQTSGNCSAASTFYASSSLSSSSPLLALSGIAPNNSSSFIMNSIANNTSNNSNNNNYSKTTTNNCRSVMTLQLSDFNVQSKVDRDDSGLGTDFTDKKIKAQSISILQNSLNTLNQLDNFGHNTNNQAPSSVETSSTKLDSDSNVKLSVIEEVGKQQIQLPSSTKVLSTTYTNSNPVVRFKPPTFASSANLMSKTSHGHYTTMSRLNYYFMNRHPYENNSETTIDFQCLDCDQFIDVDHSTILTKSNQIRLLQESDAESMAINSANENGASKDKPLTMDQLDRAYIAAMNGLPLCKTCEKKRIERKEIISEFVETELKYGRDLKIIHDEFCRPMRIAGLLSKDQINGVFLNLEELIIVHCKFADRLEAAISEAHLMGDVDYNTVNIGRLFVGSAEMLSAFESYCIRQGSAACLLARLAKEKELLRIFLRVSQMENTLLRRMNLAAFLMVPVQRVTKYPLLLNRLYKVTAYHHKDREALRDAQLKVELHLEHINQQTKGCGATNKIWRRISNLSAPISSRRGLINAEDIGYIKLRKTAMDMLKWDRDETQFIHSGKINFAPLNEYLTKQKMKPIRYMAAHALLVVLGKPNWKYRPDLVKATLDNKLMTPTPGGNGIKETALLLFREKSGRFLPCREPLFLSNCVLSNDCCQYNNECPQNQVSHHHNSKSNSNGISSNINGSGINMRKVLAASAPIDCKDSVNRQRTSSSESNGNQQSSIDLSNLKAKVYEVSGDAVSMSSLKSLPEDQVSSSDLSSPPSVAHTSRSYSLASALPRTTITTAGSSLNLTKPTNTPPSSNMTILNHLMTKVNNYHKQSMNGNKTLLVEQQQQQTKNSNATSLPPTLPVVTATTTTSGVQLTASLSVCSDMNQSANINSQQSQHHTSATDSSLVLNNIRMIGGNLNNNNSGSCNNNGEIHQQYNHHYFHNHHQPYGDYEEYFEIHERLSKESMLLRADTPLKTRYWLQMLRYHAKDLGQWRVRRNGLANIMMMHQDQFNS